MAKIINKKEELTLQHKILIFLHKNGIIFLSALGILVAVIIVLAVMSTSNARKLEADTQKIESIQDDYSTFLSMSDDDKKKNELKNKIIADLKVIIKKGTKNYPYERALLIQGNIYYKDAEWVKSAESFVKIAEYFPDSYIAPIALLNASAAYEENNDIDKAIENYQRVVDNYSDISPDTSSALFSIGRLYETKNDKESALGSYNTLIDRFPGSNWTNLARSRIIYLETRE